MGTPALAAHILERLAAAGDPRYAVAAVVTRPNEPRGRGMTVAASDVGAVAERLHLPVLKPVRIRTSTFLAEIRSFDPDLIVVAAYGRILPNEILDAPRIGTINVHASLLPRHRGAAPIEGAILAGDLETGVTIMRVTEKMDAGPTMLQRAIGIAPDDTQGTLKVKLSRLGAAALLEALDLIARDAAVWSPQDESAATYTAQVKKEDALIDWSSAAAQIERMTRAYDPWPIARTTLGAHPLMIWRARVDTAASAVTAAPGTIVAVSPQVIVACGAGRLELLEVQAGGRKRMSAADFARGRRIEAGRRLGA
jgi:methionyl-tRNA formyltransferase